MTAQQLSVILSGLKDEEVVIKTIGGIVNNIVGVEIGTKEDSGKVFLTLKNPVMIYWGE